AGHPLGSPAGIRCQHPVHAQQRGSGRFGTAFAFSRTVVMPVAVLCGKTKTRSNNMISMNPFGKSRITIVSLVASALIWALASLPAAAADSPIVFGHQAWPGVTVKSRVAVLLLDAMGYPAKSQNFTSAIIYQGLKTGDVDVSLGAWMPAHKDMVDPLVDAGDAIMLSKNLTGAIQGLA